MKLNRVELKNKYFNLYASCSLSWNKKSKRNERTVQGAAEPDARQVEKPQKSETQKCSCFVSLPAISFRIFRFVMMIKREHHVGAFFF